MNKVSKIYLSILEGKTGVNPKLIASFPDNIESIKRFSGILGMEFNEDDLVQEFLWSSGEINQTRIFTKNNSFFISRLFSLERIGRDDKVSLAIKFNSKKNEEELKEFLETFTSLLKNKEINSIEEIEKRLESIFKFLNSKQK